MNGSGIKPMKSNQFFLIKDHPSGVILTGKTCAEMLLKFKRFKD